MLEAAPDAAVELLCVQEALQAPLEGNHAKQLYDRLLAQGNEAILGEERPLSEPACASLLDLLFQLGWIQQEGRQVKQSEAGRQIVDGSSLCQGLQGSLLRLDADQLGGLLRQTGRLAKKLTLLPKNQGISGVEFALWKLQAEARSSQALQQMREDAYTQFEAIAEENPDWGEEEKIEAEQVAISLLAWNALEEDQGEEAESLLSEGNHTLHYFAATGLFHYLDLSSPVPLLALSPEGERLLLQESSP